MDKPLVVVNFKTYSSASASTAEVLAQKMEQVSNSNARMVAVVSAFDLYSVSNLCDNLEVWSQHLDPVGQGSFTGWLEPQTAISRGAQGTVINHAEHKVSIEDVKKLLSLELTGVWVNEAREIPKSIIDAVTMRCGRFPSMREGGPSWSGVICDTNAPEEDASVVLPAVPIDANNAY